MITGHFHPDAQPVLRVLYGARDPRVVDLARNGIDRAWAAGAVARASVWHGIWELARSDGHRRQPPDLKGALPAAARDFLLAADPSARHEPGIRLVAAFDDDEVAWKPESRLVVEAATVHGDDLLADALGRTDQPDLLAALESASLASLLSVDPPLWIDTPLLAVLRVNPVLPRPPAEADNATTGALLAIVMNRLDLLDGFDEWQLFIRTKDVLRRDPPADIADRFRWVLRRPGPMAEVVRRSAMNGDAVALVVWEETGGQTTDPHWRAAHLFWTRDWAAYDETDPDGRLLREFLVGPTYTDPRITGHVAIADRFREIAAQHGRPDPLPPPPRTDPQPADGRRFGGSWPTSYTGHSGFGGHF
jgi:hypothetical protein